MSRLDNFHYIISTKGSEPHGFLLYCYGSTLNCANPWKMSLVDNNKKVSMIRKYHNHKPQTTPWHFEEEPLNHHETPGKANYRAYAIKRDISNNNSQF